MLEELPNLFGADFEVSSKWTKKEKEVIKYRLDNFKLPFFERRELLQQLTSDGLSHPSLTVVTHLSVGWSDKDAFVIVCDNDAIRSLIFNFLVSTNKVQIWHNISFDGRHIYYNTHHLPKYFIDSQLLAKSILNNANPLKDNTKLKELMAYKYGKWALSKDMFSLEEQWNDEMLEYSATDACACYSLFEDIMRDRNEDISNYTKFITNSIC